jgi:hypothetical protein
MKNLIKKECLWQVSTGVFFWKKNQSKGPEKLIYKSLEGPNYRGTMVKSTHAVTFINK